jgi:hypothetical protein
VPPTEVPVETQVAADGDLFIQLLEPADLESFSDEATFTVVGRTRIDAVVTVNDNIVEPDIDGTFSSIVELEEGPNIIEIVASGDQKDIVLVVIYLP